MKNAIGAGRMGQQVTIENEYLKVGVSTHQKGVSILSIQNKSTGKEWLYSDCDKLIGRTAKDSYDNQYFGGCEFMFPNDTPVQILDRNFQDHGYLWTTEFTSIDSNNTKDMSSIEFRGYLELFKIQVTVTINLPKLESRVGLTLSLKNESEEEIPYLLRLHPSFLVDESCKLFLRGKTIFFEEGELGAAYCSFKTKEMIQAYPVISTDSGDFSIEDITSSTVSELFCHIIQEEGRFTIRDGTECVDVTYQQKDFPYLTMYYLNNERCIAMIEPDTAKSADLKRLIDMRDNETILPLQEKSYTVNIEVS